MMKKIVIGVIFVLIFACGGKTDRKATGFTDSGSDSGGVWLATYLMGKKVGWAVTRCVPVADGYKFDNIMSMTISMLGKIQRVNFHSRVVTNADWTLRSFQFELGSQDGLFKANGRVEDGWLIMERVGAKGSHRIKLTRQLYPIEALGRIVVTGNYESGMSLNYLTFDGTVMDTLPTTVTVLGPESIKLNGGTMPALKVKVKRAKTEVTTWLDGNGMTVKEESPMGLNSYRVSEKEALAGESGYPVDLLRLFAVSVDTVVFEPSKVRRVVMEVSGLDTAEFDLDGTYQRVMTRSPLRLEIVTPSPILGRKLPTASESEYLQPSVSIQADAAPIKEKAREIVRGVEDASAAAERILNWVHRSLKKEAVASLPNALDVLKNLKGDCNEHSVLYAALSRAAGIPAKVVVGLVYLDGAFYYHAWNEVYLDRWVPVDATFGEFPASSLHLKLAEGELSRQAELLGLVKKIGIKILEFE